MSALFFANRIWQTAFSLTELSGKQMERNYHTFPLNSHTIPFWFRVIVLYRVIVCTPSVYFHEKSQASTLKNTTAKAERCRKPVDFKGLRLL